jgi:hypothetical protein
MLGIPTLYFDTTSTARLDSVRPHLGLKRVDISQLGHRPPSQQPTDIAEWKRQVKEKLRLAEEQQ